MDHNEPADAFGPGWDLMTRRALIYTHRLFWRNWGFYHPNSAWRWYSYRGRLGD